jgi:Zn-dependent protease
MGMGTPIALGKIFGVMVRLDISLFLLAAFYIVDGLRDNGAQGAIDAATFSVLLFFCIYLHEMGHAFGGWLFNIRTLDVTLTFFGGYARLVGNPRTPFQQVVVSFAGPAVNLLIGVALFWYAANVENASWLVRSLAYVNVFLGLFNLLPGYPLDGGHITAAVLSNFMPSSRAQLITAYIGVGIGFLLVAMGIQGIYFSFFAAIVGLMLILAASQQIQINRGGRF